MGSANDPLAQSVEHLTFNQGVRSSSLRWVTKKPSASLGAYPKGQFFKNMVYLKRGMPYFVFVDTNAVLVRKIDKA